MTERKSKEEVKPIETKLDEPKEPPTLVSLNEFISTLNRENRIETIGSFIYWMQRKGNLPKLSLEIWKKYFGEFVTRKT
jgi:hypothetical protein